MGNRAVIRINVHEDKSNTYDVLLSDGPDGDNTIEVNCINEKHARDLIDMLDINSFSIQPEFYDDYNA